MSSTTLLLAVTGSVFCGTSFIGAVMILFLWLQSNRSQTPRAMSTPPPPQPTYTPASPAVRQTLAPNAMPVMMSQPPAPLPANPSPSVQFWFDGIGGMIAGQRIIIDGSHILIGRSGVCNMQFHDPKISRQQAILRFVDGYYQIEDMRSTGGTYVNGKQITVHRLRDRDQIRMGDSVLVFRQQ